MSSMATSAVKFQSILDAAFESYAKETGIDLRKHPSADKLQNCHSAEDVVRLLLERETAFNDYRDKYHKLIDCFRPIIQVVHAFSGVLGDAADLVPFKPTKAIFVCVDVLLSAADSVSASYDALLELFQTISSFLKRFHVYTEKIPLSPMMSDIATKIMVEVLSVLALATKQINQGRFKKFAKKLLGESEVEAILQRLGRLIQEEARVTAVHTVEIVHELFDTLKVVMNDGKASTNGMRLALDKISNEIHKMKRDQLQEKIRSWLSPPDASTNHNIARRCHHDGTASWFTMSGTFKEWKATGSLLWIHGKPGAGKSVLCSSIIQHVESLDIGSALMGYFYCDFRNPKKQDVDALLASLVAQLSARSNACYSVLSALYSKCNAGSQQPGDDALTDCLKNMLQVEKEPTLYIIIDALDECPNIKASDVVSPRERVLKLVEELVGLQLVNVRICVTSRPEADIRASLGHRASHCISLHDEDGQRKDIADYVGSVVHSMEKWRKKDKENVIKTLSQKANGMFRWIACQLEVLKPCLPAAVRRVLENLPGSLDETYDRILLGIAQANREYAQRLFQCISVSIRPLRVEELAEILAIQFDGALPEYDLDWRPENPEQEVLSVCSSLITIVDVDGSRVVQFSHFSVQEYLSSERLANAGHHLSQYHIHPHSAHTILAQASLSVLLALDDEVNKDVMKNFSLATYAARYLVDHAQLENVLSSIKDGMRRLFDAAKPHFATWVWIYDIDHPFREIMFAARPTPPEAVPLYYAALCGFHDLLEHLINTCPRDVNARGGYHCTPLHVATAQRDVDVMKLLLAHGADVMALGNKMRTPLHEASERGHLEMLEFLLGRGADVDAQDNEGMTPFYLASCEGKLEVVRALLRHGASVDCRSIKGWSSLQVAAQTGHLGVVQLLFESGAAVDSRSNDGWTPLLVASQNGHLDVVDFLLQTGAAVDFRHKDGQTPLYHASIHGHLDVIRLLLRSAAAVDLPDNEGWTPLHVASQHGRLDVVRLLHRSGATVDSTSNSGWNSLHIASRKGHLDVVRVLLQNGATVNSRSDSDPNKWCPSTPLHLASANGHLSVAQLLVSFDADPNTRDQNGKTPIDLALKHQKLDVARFLVGHVGSVDSRHHTELTALSAISQSPLPDVTQPSPGRTTVGNIPDNTKISLHTASKEGNLGIVKSLIDDGADVNERSTNHATPLHFAVRAGKVEVAKLLIECDANVNSRDSLGWAPLHRASRQGHFDIVHLLLKHSADVNAETRSHDTALHLALNYHHFKIAKLLLLQEGANVLVRNDKGQTPSHLASREGAWEIVRLLSDYGAGM